jgi:hypothetical protein
MVARGAAWNVSVFQKGGKAEWETVKRQYLRKVLSLQEYIIHLFCCKLGLIHAIYAAVYSV